MSIKNKIIKHKVFLQRYVKHEVAYYSAALQAAVKVLDAGKKKKVMQKLQERTKETFQRLQKLAAYETKFIAKTLKVEVPKNTKDIKDLSLTFATRKKEYNLQDAYEQFDTYAAQKLAQEDKDNFGTKAAVGSLVLGAVLSRYNALSSTAVNSISTDAQVAVFEENPDIIDSVVWDATLDDATCPDCEDLNGQEFEIGSIEEACPLHANCRCALVPVVQNG